MSPSPCHCFLIQVYTLDAVHCHTLNVTHIKVASTNTEKSRRQNTEKQGGIKVAERWTMHTLDTLAKSEAACLDGRALARPCVAPHGSQDASITSDETSESSNDSNDSQCPLANHSLEHLHHAASPSSPSEGWQSSARPRVKTPFVPFRAHLQGVCARDASPRRKCRASDMGVRHSSPSLPVTHTSPSPPVTHTTPVRHTSPSFPVTHTSPSPPVTHTSPSLPVTRTTPVRRTSA